MIAVREIVKAARSYIGTPFRHQGRVPSRGLDCAGVAVCAYRAAGLQVRDYLSYYKVPTGPLVTRMLADNLGQPRKSHRDGDVAVFWISTMRNLIHMGIIDGGSFIHVMEGAAVVSTPLVGSWRRRLDRVYGVR